MSRPIIKTIILIIILTTITSWPSMFMALLTIPINMSGYWHLLFVGFLAVLVWASLPKIH